MHSLKIVYFEQEDPDTERAVRSSFQGNLEDLNQAFYQAVDIFKSSHDDCLIKYIAITKKEALTPEEEISRISFNIPYATYKK
jgi:hypothetical protein